MRLLILAATLFLAQGPLTWTIKGPSGEFYIEADRSDAALLGPGKISLRRNPAPGGHLSRVIWRDAGISVAANDIDIETATDPKSGDFYVNSGLILGNAVLVKDSQAADAYAAQHAKETGAAAPAPSPQIARLEVSSQAFTYTGNFDVGKLVVPENFNSTAHYAGSQQIQVKGGKATRDFDDHAEAHGSRGEIELNTHAGQENAIRRGSIQGPVTFKYDRASKVDGKPEPPTIFNGRADRLDIDFMSEKHTITLTGNVQFAGQSQHFTGSATGAKAVLTFGPGGDLEGFEMEGSTVTTAKPIKTGNGGR